MTCKVVYEAGGSVVVGKTLWYSNFTAITLHSVQLLNSKGFLSLAEDTRDENIVNLSEQLLKICVFCVYFMYVFVFFL